MNIKKELRCVSGAEIIRHLALSWLIAAVFCYIAISPDKRTLSGLASLSEMSFLGTLIAVAVIFSALFALARYFDTAKWERIATAVAFCVLAAFSLYHSFTLPFLCACLLLAAILLIYAAKGTDIDCTAAKIKPANKAFVIVTAALSIVFFAFVSLWTVCRVYSFGTPTFDFGIFAQMFHNMKETGLPVTTVERDGPLSHFDVHVSPVYYLLLPFYMIFPKPEILQVLQAAVLASSAIPLWLIGKRRGLTGLQRTLLCTLLLVYPAISGGTSYDIHENCFLAPFILWLFLGVELKNIGLIAVFSILTLTVKEDAALYVAVIALYIIIRSIVQGVKVERRMLIVGVSTLAFSVAWFFAVTSYLANVGDGVMTYRYSNFMYDGSGSLLTVIKAVIMNPMKAVFECVDAEKLGFIALTLLPLLGLPFVTRKYERFILFIPYLLVNLMSDYRYQHDIFFQYSFGTSAFLFYLTAVNLSEFKIDKLRTAALGTACAVGMSFFAVNIIPKADTYITGCIDRWEYYSDIREALDTIPEDASVAATTYYTTHLSDREVLYDIKHSSKEHILECEYVAIAKNSESALKKYATDDLGGFEAFIDLLADKGYELFHSLDGVLLIYRRGQG